MNRELYYKLQNGSDIRGVALEGIEGEHVNLTSEAAKDFAKSFAHFVAKRTGKKVEELKLAVGHDSRLSANQLKTAVIDGITETGSCRSGLWFILHSFHVYGNGTSGTGI